MASRQHTLGYFSSYDRGLSYLLFMWPDIKAEYPDAELHICYGWQTFDALTRDNPERQQWKQSIESMMQQDGVVHHGRVGKGELAKIRKSCGIWAYPTDFTEINCITALECQRDGVVPVTMAFAALNETVGAGVKLEGDIKDISVQKVYLAALLDMMGNSELWKSESKKGIGFAKKYEWEDIAGEWVKEFKAEVYNPTVSVVTVTIREGFWNIMAENLSKQTHKDFEWVIVDDHVDDRSKIAEKYAKKYGLDIKYVRGDKALDTYKRKFGLVRANNIGYKTATGELLIYLQDFILIPENGVESIVDVHRHNPNALIAPVDVLYLAKPFNKKNTEDWWDGNTDVLVNEVWRNVRVQFLGMRETGNPYDFEMNYAGIPRKILEHLNGWYEFFDDGIGYDNTEIAQRALSLGYKIIIDDTNIAKAIDIGHDRPELNSAIWERFNQGDVPAIRDEKLDASIISKET